MLAKVKAALNLLAGRRHYPVPLSVRPRSLEEQVFQAIVTPGQVIYDVGANRGGAALMFARLTGPLGLVYAFEPSMQTYADLCRNIQAATDARAPIVTFPLALSDVNGNIELSVPIDQTGMASMKLSNDARRLMSGSLVRVESSTCIELDRLVKSGGLRPPDFVKVDVEGAEILTLRGARQVLETAKPVLHVEVFAPWQKAFGVRPWDVLEYLSRFGYEFLFACPNGLVRHEPSAASPFPDGFDQAYNVVGVIPSKHAPVIERLDRLKAGAANLLPVPSPPCPNVVSA